MLEYLHLMKSEAMILLIIFILLFIKLGKGMHSDLMLSVVQLLLLVTVVLSFVFNDTGRIFSGMFFHNALIGFQKGILVLAVYIISLVCADWFRKSEHLAEVFVLMLSALLGMCLLISADHLLMFYLALELSSIPVAALANFDLERRKSAEAAMKMIMNAALASGIMLFGISLIYGLTGTLDFAQLWGGIKTEPIHIMAFIFFFSAFAFKLSVVPFHLWTADVYEGAPVPVSAFLSAVSKGAVTFAMVSVLSKVFVNLGTTWYILVVGLSVITMLVGNLFAVRQENILRFLAFSSIAQVGFILVGVSGQPEQAVISTTYFVLVYVFSNLAAFGVAAVILTQAGISRIQDLKGLYTRSPLLAWSLSLGLFSLAGVPPAAGFFGKMFLLMAGASRGNYLFIAVAALNMIISLYYYLRVVRLVFTSADQPLPALQVTRPVRFGLFICLAGIILAGVVSWIYEHIQSLV